MDGFLRDRKRGGGFAIYTPKEIRSIRDRLVVADLYRAATSDRLSRGQLGGLRHQHVLRLSQAYVFVALFAARPEVVGYQLDDALVYTWLTQALLMYTYLWGWWDVANTIRSGQVASDLSKPFDYYSYWLSRDVGRAVYHLLFRGVPTYLAGVVLFGVGVPSAPVIWLGFLASLACAELVSFGFRFLVNLSAFWLLDVRGVGVLAGIFSMFFSGMLVPNAFFPDWLRAISDLLPFQGIIYVPTSVFLGKFTGASLVWALGQQLVWFLAMMALGRVALAMAARRLVVQGG